MKKELKAALLLMVSFCFILFIGCGRNTSEKNEPITTTDVSTQSTEIVTEPVETTTAVQARKLISQDLTYVYDEDIKALLWCEFTINDKEKQPYVTFKCSNNGAGTEAVFICYLSASSENKEYERKWKVKSHGVSTTDCTGEATFLTGNEASWWNKPYGNYIQYGTVLLRVTEITYWGYENILE